MSTDKKWEKMPYCNCEKLLLETSNMLESSFDKKYNKANYQDIFWDSNFEVIFTSKSWFKQKKWKNVNQNKYKKFLKPYIKMD